MLLELLVVSVCVNNQGGCSQATSAYYKQNVELQQIAKNVDKFGKEITNNNQWLVYVGAPMYAMAARQPAKILLYKGTVLTMDPYQHMVGLQWSY